jgi:hypothetical protein
MGENSERQVQRHGILTTLVVYEQRVQKFCYIVATCLRQVSAG